MSVVDYRIDSSIAVITMNCPPVNGLGRALRQDVKAALERALKDASVKGVVLTGSQNLFSAGADIAEFAAGGEFQEPTLPHVIAAVEASNKPVIAAIGGVCMGGGFELALGCHGRVATREARFALPEVKLGLLPGAGGTQRLPRAIGVRAALDLIVSGGTINGEKAAALGVVELVSGDLASEAMALAKSIVRKRGALPRLSERIAALPEGESADTFFAAAREKIAAASRGYPAPLKCLEAVEAAVRSSFKQGLQREWQLYSELSATTESRALQHAFFGERAAAKIPDVPETTLIRPIRKAAVIGAGTMGGGIAMNFANAGIPVTVLEMRQEALDRGLGIVWRNYEATAKKGRLTMEQVEGCMSLITGTLDYADIRDADIVMEAVFEDMSIKEKVFHTLDEVMKPGAILATNTSTLDIDKIASFTKRPQEVIGTHFFSPANVMRLIEVVRGDKTAKDVLATTMRLAKKIGKVGVVSMVCDGFIGNRMFEEYLRQAYFLLDEGALPWQVDRALQEWGMAMGPFAVMDLAGQDIGYKIRTRRAVEQPHKVYSKIPDRVCELGRHGQKTGAGFYKYAPGNRVPQPDPEIEKLIVDYSQEIGLKRRDIHDEEIVGRCILALVNEGARILDEGIALRASDIDIVYLTGYGFPTFRGGPMFYADTLGLEKVVSTIEQYAKNPHTDAAFWQPAQLLAKLAKEGRNFN